MALAEIGISLFILQEGTIIFVLETYALKAVFFIGLVQKYNFQIFMHD